MLTSDPVNAFVAGPRIRIEGRPKGPLAGLTFAAKDLFDIAGYRTGGGNHDWARQSPVPTRHAWAVQKLLDAGASLVGKTITDEVSLGILGENRFDGTPMNSRAPDRVPGGSSSGSAAAVAAGLCDFAIGTDTGGSVRVPASFCGLFGMRPTHGRVDVSGMMSQAPSSDTIGWLTRDAETLAKVSRVMFEQDEPATLPTKLILAIDAFGFAAPEVTAALAPMLDRLRALVGDAREEVMASAGIITWARAQRTLQRYEAWLTFKDWIDQEDPRLAFSVARNLAFASLITEDERNWASLVRQEARGRMRYLLSHDAIICQPTTPFPAPKRAQASSVLNPLKDRILSLCSHGGLTGVPEISLPGASIDGLPVGLSIIADYGGDMTLVAVAQALDAK